MANTERTRSRVTVESSLKNMSRSKGTNVIKDFYKILQVSSDATTTEIKTSYRKLALTLHPDRHDGDKIKTKAFKETTEAYNILVDSERRRQYDIAHGFSSRNRRRPPPANYRKVYAPHPPPDGKWHDAQRHYDMHYGDGMYHDALKSAYKRAEAMGDFDYHSPLGKGFVFDTINRKSRANNNSSSSNSSDDSQYNPYSKALQGPPSQAVEYEESYISEAKTIMKRREGVISMLHERRRERRKLEITQPIYESFNNNAADACTIM